ncbi:MAG: DUF1559 domain-containing protein [Planctomycetaceae bacterium]|jgi:hypothetical protein|nr:DUF1559 domain-containing protein [Planctomycetaceae bacterium]
MKTTSQKNYSITTIWNLLQSTAQSIVVLAVVVLTVMLLSVPPLFAQDEPSNDFDRDAVPAYTKISPLIKESTYVAVHVDLSKIDLDKIIAILSPRLKRISESLNKSNQDTPVENLPESNPPANESEKTPPAPVPETPAPATPTTANPLPAIDAPSPIIAQEAKPAEAANTADAENNNATVDNIETDGGEVGGTLGAAGGVMISIDAEEMLRVAIGSILGEFKASGVSEFYILSMFENVNQQPTFIAIPGRIKLTPTLSATLASINITPIAEQVSGFTLFFFDPDGQANLPNDHANLPDGQANLPNEIAAPTATPNAPASNIPTPPNPAAPPATTPAEVGGTPAGQPAGIRTRPAPHGGGFNPLANLIPAKPAAKKADVKDEFLKKLRKAKTVHRPEIQSALHIQRNAPIRIVIAPTRSIHTYIAGSQTFLQFSGMSAEELKDISEGAKLAKSLHSISFGIIPDQLRINFAAEFDTEANAKKAHSFLDAFAKKAVEKLREYIVSGDEVGKQLTAFGIDGEVVDGLATVLADIMPRQRNNRLISSVKESFFDKYEPNFVQLLLKAGQEGIEEQCTQNVETIIEAVFAYYDKHDVKFPPLYTVDANGKPLHSWRVLILPYLGQEELYSQIKLDEAWDSEHNKQFHNRIIPAFTCPANPKTRLGKTCTYSVIANEVFKPKESGGVGDIKDGASDTLAIVEVREPFCWMNPEADVKLADLDKGINQEGSVVGSYHDDGAYAAFFIRTIKLLKNETPAKTLKAIGTAAGGETDTELP